MSICLPFDFAQFIVPYHIVSSPGQFLSENKKYANLTNDDRVAYMLIKDRYRYSLSNNWIDKDKNVYVYFTIEELRQLLHVGKNKGTCVKNRLIDERVIFIC